jgi:hypothetical protein
MKDFFQKSCNTSIKSNNYYSSLYFLEAKMRTVLAITVIGFLLLSSCSTGNGTRDDYFGYAPKKEVKVEREDMSVQEQIQPETVYVYSDYAAQGQNVEYSYNVYPSVYFDPWNMYGGIGFYAGAYPFYFGINVGFPIYYPHWVYAPYYPYWYDGYCYDYYPNSDWCWGYDGYYGDGYYDEDYYEDDTWRDDPRDFGPSRGQGETDYNNGDWKPNRRSTKPVIAREAGPLKNTVNNDISPKKGRSTNTDYTAKKKIVEKETSPLDKTGASSNDGKPNPKYVLPPEDLVSKTKQSKDINRMNNDIKGFAPKNQKTNNTVQADANNSLAGTNNTQFQSGGVTFDNPVKTSVIKQIQPASVARSTEYRKENSLKEIPKINFKVPDQSKSIKNSSGSENADFFGSLVKAVTSASGSDNDDNNNNSSGSKGYSSSKSGNSSNSSSNRGSSGNSSGKSSSGGFNRGKR